MRIKRVGSITCGISLIVFGVLFLLSSFLKQPDYRFILHFWPVILIGLGAEMLAAAHHSLHDEKCTLKYDAGAIILMMIMLLFASGMGIAEFCLRYAEAHSLWYY